MEKYFEELESKGVIKSSSHNRADFFAPELMAHNYRRLDKYYDKGRTGNDLDERIFLKERMANLTPSKFTPFARQGYNNKGRRGAGLTDQKENYSSHRILNY